MADVELLPCGECGMPCRPDEYHPFAACLMFKACHNSETVRANMEPLRADHAALRAEYYRVVHALQDEQARAERLAEALQEAAGEMASIGDAIGHDHPEARRIFTLRANLISARLAALVQEDRND